MWEAGKHNKILGNFNRKKDSSQHPGVYLQLFSKVVGAYLDFHSISAPQKRFLQNASQRVRQKAKRYVAPRSYSAEVGLFVYLRDFILQGKKTPATVEGSLCFKQGQGEEIA